ncbi:HIT-like protein [Sparassis latifolia]
MSLKPTPGNTRKIDDTAFKLDNLSSRCMFCHATPENGFDVVWENDTYTVFKDNRPATVQHFQVIPKRHIESVKCLTKADADMVREMEWIGHRVLEDLDVPASDRRLGFHVPPFNSVSHLHLHVQALPYKSSLMKLEFLLTPGRNGSDKGISWFADVGQTVRILEKGGRVKVLSC